MEFNLGVILATLINFLILLFGLKYFFFDKVKMIIESRENEIIDKLDSVDEELGKARTLAIKNERELQKAREEGKAITERYKKKAEKVYDEIVGTLIQAEQLKCEDIFLKYSQPPYGMSEEIITLMIAVICANLSYCLRFKYKNEVKNINNWKELVVIKDKKIDIDVSFGGGSILYKETH